MTGRQLKYKGRAMYIFKSFASFSSPLVVRKSAGDRKMVANSVWPYVRVYGKIICAVH